VSHVEFPVEIPEAKAAFDAAILTFTSLDDLPPPSDFRRCLAAFLREALGQAGVSSAITWSDVSIIGKLFAIANNLHSPPPPAPPPTLAEARAADLDTPEGKAAVRDFLATLVEWVQP
jgi:hypothetical protein